MREYRLGLYGLTVLFALAIQHAKNSLGTGILHATANMNKPVVYGFCLHHLLPKELVEVLVLADRFADWLLISQCIVRYCIRKIVLCRLPMLED